jgi:heavy metal translocating P-type ATPase
MSAVATPGLLARAERLLLGAQLTLAMLSAGLLVVAVVWKFLAPDAADMVNLVAAAAAALVAVPVLASAWQSLRHPGLQGIADRLVALALLAAWAAGDLMTAAVLPIVMILGHVLEERSLLGTQEAVRALGRLAETRACRLLPGGSELVPASALRPGDRIELRAGDRVPADGIVRAGSASLDMASLTGEPIPVDVTVGDAVPAGTIDTNGLLEVEITRIGTDSTVGRIIALMRTAEASKPAVTRVLERHGEQYMALVLMAAAGTWFISGSLPATLAVLVASCPCALVLATPATAIAAIAVAARHGILIKGTGFLENMASVDAVVFDKTGTLTTGILSLAGTSGAASEANLLHVAAALGAASNHPVSRAAAAAVPVAARAAVSEAREEGGFGVTGLLDGVVVAFGRPALFTRLGIAVPAPPVHDGPVAGVSLGDTFLGWLLFADRPRLEAATAVEELRALGLERQVLLTGDRASVARRVGAEVGIAVVCADALPDQKMRRVQAETRAGWRALVVGDGINDSLALKAGAVGVAMGAQGSDVVLASADIVLTGNNLRRLATAVRLSRRCRQTIHVNVAMGLGWTAVLVGLAASGALGPQGPIVAALLHNLSTFLGLANAGRLLLFDETEGDGEAAISFPAIPHTGKVSVVALHD